MILHDVPALPDGVLVQEVYRDSGLVDRVTEDGRWLQVVGDAEPVERPAFSRRHDGPRVAEVGLARIADALLVLPSLPPTSPATVSADVRIPPGVPVQLRPIAFTARVNGGVYTVEVSADPRLPSSFGALEPLVNALGDEVYGDWANE